MNTTINLAVIVSIVNAVWTENTGASRSKLLKLAFDRMESFNYKLADCDKDQIRVLMQEKLDKTFKLNAGEIVIGQPKSYTKITNGGVLEQGRRFTTLDSNPMPVDKQLFVCFQEFANFQKRAAESQMSVVNPKSFERNLKRYSDAVYSRIQFLATTGNEDEKATAAKVLANMERRMPGDKRNQVKFAESVTTSVVNQDDKQPETVNS